MLGRTDHAEQIGPACANLGAMPTSTMSSQELAVLDANDAFYQAFRERDATAMQSLWSSAHPVACIHPGWAVLHGRDEVLASWQAIIDNPSSPRVECVDAVATVWGDAAYVTCVELIGDVELAATNVFARESGGWTLVHHQAAPFARDADDQPDLSQLN
jgi:ketosteroid isomerase-like protein